MGSGRKVLGSWHSTRWTVPRRVPLPLRAGSSALAQSRGMLGSVREGYATRVGGHGGRQETQPRVNTRSFSLIAITPALRPTLVVRCSSSLPARMLGRQDGDGTRMKLPAAHRSDAEAEGG